MRTSKYSILFERENIKLLYSTRYNNFYSLSDSLYNFLISDRESEEALLDSDDQEAYNYLIRKKIVTDAEEDLKYFESLKLNFLMQNYETSTLNLTILPTLGCNLRCPYCFEENKRPVNMTRETADLVVDFVSSHKKAKEYTLTWFGGEPLLNPEIIKYLLSKFEKKLDIECSNHSIVTNGTLINSRIIELFKQFPLHHMQITFDGNEKSHNNKRFFENGSGSFQLILRNIEAIVNNLPDTYLSLRVNLDNDNSHEYDEILEIINQRFAGAKLRVYPAVLRANPGCSTPSFFTSQDTVKFYTRLYSKNGKFNFYPQFTSKGCTATRPSAHVIGPSGELYKCWEDVGNTDWIIGNISDSRLTNENLMARYSLHGNCFGDAACMECPLLPLCDGGCAHKRLRPHTTGSLCTYLNHDNHKAIEDFLFMVYKNSHPSAAL